MLQKIRNTKAFTIIELLIVMAIITIVTAVVFSTIRDNSDSVVNEKPPAIEQPAQLEDKDKKL